MNELEKAEAVEAALRGEVRCRKCRTFKGAKKFYLKPEMCWSCYADVIQQYVKDSSSKSGYAIVSKRC
jgi:hypothetical protein